jgi:uncharacterized membrane protein
MYVTPPGRGNVGVFPEKIAGGLAYLTFIPAVVLLLLQPYNKNRFVRFHALQCLWFWAAGVVLGIAIKLVSLILFIIPALGPLLVTLLAAVLLLGIFVIWVVLLVKALGGEAFKLPWIGDLAERQAGAV